MNLQAILICVALCGAALVSPLMASEPADLAGIRHVMMTTWDKPDSRLVVEPVVIAGNHAIAGWSQSEMGGRALLRKQGANWEVVLCAGDALKHADILKKVGLPEAAAVSLANDLAIAERSVAPARLALFSRFEGLVMVGGDGGHHGHQPAAGHHGHK